MITKPSHSGNSPEENPSCQKQEKRSFWRKKIVLGFSSLIIGSIGSSLVYGWFYLQQELPPKIEAELENFLNRPVKLGGMKQFLLGQINFGETEILPVGDDPAKVSMKGLNISYNPIVLLTQGKLHLEITAIEPNLYLEQGKSGEWLSTPVDVLNPDYPVNLKVLRWKKANATLLFRSEQGQLKSPLNLQETQGQLRLKNQGKFVEFELNSQVKKGKLKVQGIADATDQTANLSLQGNQLSVIDIQKTLDIPLDLKEGTVNANLDIKSAYGQLPQIQGTATLNNVTANLSQLPTPFTQLQGNLLFRGETITFDQVKGNLKNIQGITSGILHQEKGLNLTVKTQPTTIDKIRQSLSLPQFTFPIQGEVKSLVKVQGNPQKPSVLVQAITTKPTQVNQFIFKQIQANINVQGDQLVVDQLTALPTQGGNIKGKGLISLETLTQGSQSNIQPSDYRFKMNFQDLLMTQIPEKYRPDIPLAIGNISGNAQVVGNVQNPDEINVIGSSSFPVAEGIAKVEHFVYNSQQWQAKVNLADLSLNVLPITKLQVQETDKLQGRFTIIGKNDNFEIEKMNIQGTGEVTLAGGKVSVSQLNIAQGKWWGNFTATQLNAQNLFSQSSLPLTGTLQGNFSAQGELKNYLESLQASGHGTIISSNGIIQSDAFSISQGKWQTQLRTDNLSLVGLIPQLPNDLQGDFTGQINLTGDLDNPTASLQGKGVGNIQLTKGSIKVSTIEIDQENFTSDLTPDQIPLSSFSEELKGNLGGNITLVGNWQNSDIKTMTAQGKVTFSQGIAFVNHPLTTEFNWQNQQLDIIQASAIGLDVKGWVKINSDRLIDHPLDSIKSFDLQVNTEGLNINQVALPSVPLDPQYYSGQLDFKGRVTGTVQTPIINGDLALINLTLPDLTFEKALEGKINTNQQGINLNIAGIRDKIEVSLNQDYQLTEFSIQYDNLKLLGVKQDNQLYVESQNLPLSLVNLYLAFQGQSIPKTLSGEVSGNFRVNLDNSAVIGTNVTIKKPQIDWLKGDKFTGNFHYLNEQIWFKDSQLAIQNSRYDFQANVGLNSPTPTLEADIKITQGKMEDILQTLHLFDISDFNRGIKPPNYQKAADLSVSEAQALSNVVAEAGLPKGTLGEQLDYFKQLINEMQEKKEKEQENLIFPPLKDLQGDITGHLSLKTSAKSEIEATFKLLGKTWKWGDWRLDTVQIDGSWQNGTLILDPLQISSNKSTLFLAGQFEDHYQTGKLQIINVPISPFSRLIDLPDTVNLQGWVNADLEVGGTRNNPLAQGTIIVNNATFNQGKLQQTQGDFTYQDARLNFEIHSFLANKGEAILIKGTIPYQFPFAKVEPNNQDFSVQLNIKDDGLALLNLITQDQLNWGGGKGDVNLAVMGKVEPKTHQIEQIDADGFVKIQQATLNSPLFPEQGLTQVNGTFDLNLDRIQVEQLTGNFSGGLVTMTGSLPLTDNSPQKQPLTLQFENLALNLPQVYQGGVKGQLEITGTAFKPILGGNINLYQGSIFLSDALVKRNPINEPSSDVLGFNQLQLTLGENMRLYSSPILNFAVNGNLILNGKVNQPRPSGQINLLRGQVNLLASQLRLTGENNKAEFFPEKGLDPYITLNLATAATETTRNRVRLDTSSSEINDPFTANQESLQTVRIAAKIEGLASQLEQSIELSSNPQRSEREILVLLGGNLANLENEGNTTVGLANLAGSAVLGSVQGEIGSALGLSEFRIFPTQIINETERINSSQLGIAAEAGIDLTDDISLSILKILNTDRPPQWGIRYRLNEKILIRGSSNFDDDSRGVIEYEHRF